MSDPYDPYRPNPNNPYGQPGGSGPGGPQQPYGGQQRPYGQQPGGPYQGGQPYQPYQGGQPYQQPPDPTRQFDPYATQQLPQYGSQPYQGAYGQQPGWTGGPGGPGGFPPQPPKKSRTPLVILAVLAALLLLGGGITAAVALTGDDDPVAGPTTSAAPTSGQSTTTTRRTTSSRPPATTTTTTAATDFQVGQCATLTPEGNGRATIRVTECGGLLSDVVIAKVQPEECAEPFLSFNPGEGKFYCLAMDAKEGDCFRFDNLIKRALACVGDDTRKVVKIYDGVADRARCESLPGEVLDVYAYPDPPKTLCLGKADL